MSGGGSPTLRQNHYRFRVDGSDREATPTWGAAEDTTYYPGQDTPFRLRFAVDNTGTAAAATGPWPAYSLNGGAYTLINASSSVVRIQDASSGGASANIATANLRLTAGSGSSAIGRYFDAVTAVSKIAAGTYTEYEYGLLIRDADVAPGDTIDFRLYDSDGTALGTAYSTYNVTPRVTIPTALSAAPSATSYSFSNDASDLTGASVNKKLVTAGATSGTWAGQSLVSQSVNSGNSVVDGSFFTESGVPSTNGSNLSGTIIVVSIDITTGNSNLRYSARAVRVNSSGTEQAWGSLSAESASGATAAYSFNVETQNLGTWASGDRLRIEVRMRNNSTSTGQSATFTYNSASSYVQAQTSSASRTVTADAGSYAVTGTTANLELGREIVPDAGSYAVTGTDASLERGFEVAADGGSYAVTGTDAALSITAKVVAAGSGSYAVTGTDANLEHGREIVPDAGSYAVTGTDATLEITVDRTVVADSGSYEVTGTDAGLELGREIVPDAGSYAVAGTDAALEYGREVAADGGSYAVTGTDASLERGLEVTAEAGSYAVTGTDATLTITPVGEKTLAADAGSYAITGTDAALEVGREVTADAGSYAVTGTDASLEYGREVTADGGSYEVTGTDATLTVTPAVGGVALAGFRSLLGLWLGGSGVGDAVAEDRQQYRGDERFMRLAPFALPGADKKRRGYDRPKLTDEFYEHLDRLRKARDAAERAEEAAKTKSAKEVVRAARKAAKIIARQASAAEADSAEWAAIAEAARALGRSSTKQVAVVLQLVEILVLRISEADDALAARAQHLELELLDSQRREQELLAAIIEEENAVIAILMAA
jgi:hypothetical protein